MPVRVAVVLSAGGLRGAAHAGVLRQLVRHGIRIDAIVGVSAGAHNVPVVHIRGRIHTVLGSVTGTRPIQRQSDTITCVAPIAGPRAKVSGSASLTPPSMSSSGSPSPLTAIGGNRCGIDALARTAADNGTP